MITIRTHPSASATNIGDIGLTVDGGAGSIVLDDLQDLRRASESERLRELTTDDAFGVGLSTLVILNASNNVIPQSQVEDFITSLAEAVEEEASNLSAGFAKGTLAERPVAGTVNGELFLIIDPTMDCLSWSVWVDPPGEWRFIPSPQKFFDQVWFDDQGGIYFDDFDEVYTVAENTNA